MLIEKVGRPNVNDLHQSIANTPREANFTLAVVSKADELGKNVTPDIRGLDLDKHWLSVRDTILGAYGIPPIFFSAGAQSAALREAQRHAVLWTLAPIAKLASAEFSRKLNESDFSLDLVTPLAAADSAGRARAVGVLVGTGMALDDALALVGWGDQF